MPLEHTLSPSNTSIVGDLFIKPLQMAWFMLQGFCWIDARQVDGRKHDRTGNRETFYPLQHHRGSKTKNNSLTNSGKNEVQKNTSYHWARP